MRCCRATCFSSAVDLRKQLRLSAKELKEGGYTREEIKAAGFDAAQLRGL